MSGEKPTFYGSWKGRVIKSMAVDGAQTWEDIREMTSLNPKQLNKVLSELFSVGALERTDNSSYRVQYDIYKEYVNFEKSKGENTAKSFVRITKSQQVSLRAWISGWIEIKRLDISLNKQHFFLKGRYLDELSKDIIEQTKVELLVANPFVEETDIARSLLIPAKQKVKTVLITRPNQKYNNFHKSLQEKGVNIVYNDNIHAKLIVVDRAIGFVSSMNFIPTSSAGKSWEAGIVTLEETVISSMVDSMLELIES